MSDAELEQAAIAPRRWIELSTSFAARGLRLSPTTTRIIDDPYPNKHTTRGHLILVPGGRYMVHFSTSGLGVWDLGYTSSADCKLIASVGPEGGSASGDVHATPDGMGLVICSLRPHERCSFYEIFPQSEIPQLTKIASLDLLPQHYLPSYVSPDKMIWYHFGSVGIEENQGTIFRVWDYRLNTSVSFVALIEEEKIEDNPEVVATQTAIIILHEQEVLIWAIPPLLPQPPNFDDYSLTQLPPVIRVKFPDGLALYHSLSEWRTMSSWYFDPSKPLYFDKEYPWLSLLRRFEIIIKPDFSDATLRFINSFQLTTDYVDQYTTFQSMFCEDTLVYNWSSSDQCGIYTGTTLSGPTNLPWPSITQILLAVGRPCELSICLASGRLVHLDNSGCDTDKIVVLDFLPHQRL